MDRDRHVVEYLVSNPVRITLPFFPMPFLGDESASRIRRSHLFEYSMEWKGRGAEGVRITSGPAS